jgi:GNAT superfamily N-acetyltransferase
MTEFHIRAAQPGDESQIHEAHMRSIREVCVKDHGENEIKGWGNRPLGNRWVDAIKIGHVWVVEANGRIFGHAYLRIFEEDGNKKAHINGLYLTPEVLSKGFGKRLGNLMLDTAKNAGVKSITLESTITAHEFYKSLGFAETDSIKTMEIAGHPVRYFPMVINLI